MELLDVVTLVLIVDEELLDELELLILDVEDEVVDVVVVDEEEDDDGAVPWAAVPCIKSSVYPPSLQNVRYDAEIPSEFGRKTRGIFKEAPAAKVEPTAGKLGEV